MITNKQILEILIKYDPNPFMVQDTLELSDSQYLCDNLETLFENVQEKQGTLSAIQAFDDGFCCINDSIKYRYFVLNINNVMDCTNSPEEAWKLIDREPWEESKRRFYEVLLPHFPDFLDKFNISDISELEKRISKNHSVLENNWESHLYRVIDGLLKE